MRMKKRKSAPKQRKIGRLMASIEDQDLSLDLIKESPQYYRPIKIPITLRLDADMVAWLKKQGRGYQTRINRMLRKAVANERRKSGMRECLTRRCAYRNAVWSCHCRFQLPGRRPKPNHQLRSTHEVDRKGRKDDAMNATSRKDQRERLQFQGVPLSCETIGKVPYDRLVHFHVD